nr:MAG TPA: Protein of unknown function (DUF1223) [Caudoviricetes sp.]
MIRSPELFSTSAGCSHCPVGNINISIFLHFEKQNINKIFSII